MSDRLRLPLLLRIVFSALATIALPVMTFLLWRKGDRSRDFRERLGFAPVSPSSDIPCLWFHGASVGEISGLLPLIRRIRIQVPNIRLAVTTTSLTGRDFANPRIAQVQGQNRFT